MKPLDLIRLTFRRPSAIRVMLDSVMHLEAERDKLRAALAREELLASGAMTANTALWNALALEKDRSADLERKLKAADDLIQWHSEQDGMA